MKYDERTAQKGISAFISVVILLAVSLSVAGIVLSFTTETGKQSGRTLFDFGQESVNCDLAGVLVTDALFRFPESSVSGSNYTTVEVENSGSVRLKEGVVVVAFEGSNVVNTTSQIAELEVGERRSVTFLTNVSDITEVRTNSRDCGEKSSTSTDVTREQYVAEPVTGVN